MIHQTKLKTKIKKNNDTKGLSLKIVFLIISAASVFYYRYQFLHLVCFLITSLILAIDLLNSIIKKIKRTGLN